MTDPTAPAGADLRDRIASEILRAGDGQSVFPNRAADAALDVVGPELERLRAKVTAHDFAIDAEVARLSKVAERLRAELAKVQQERQDFAVNLEAMFAADPEQRGLSGLLQVERSQRRQAEDAADKAEAERERLWLALVDETEKHDRIVDGPDLGCCDYDLAPWPCPTRKTLDTITAALRGAESTVSALSRPDATDETNEPHGTPESREKPSGVAPATID